MKQRRENDRIKTKNNINKDRRENVRMIEERITKITKRSLEKETNKKKHKEIPKGVT